MRNFLNGMMKIGIKKTKKRGFAMLELVITLGILSIITAISLPNYLYIKERSAVKSDIISSRNIVQGIKQARVTTDIFKDLDKDNIEIYIINFDNLSNFDLYINGIKQEKNELYNLFIGVNKPAVKDKIGYYIYIPKDNYKIDIQYITNNPDQPKAPIDPEQKRELLN